MDDEVKKALLFVFTYTDRLQLTRTEHTRLQQALTKIEEFILTHIETNNDKTAEPIDNDTEKALS